MNTPVLDRPLLTNLARAAAYGGLALVDPNRVRGLARGAYWTALAGASAAEVVATPDTDPRDTAPWAVAAGSLVVASIGLWERTDAWMIRALRDAGARRPRLWMAGLTVAGVAALAVVERRLERWSDGTDDEFLLDDDLRGVGDVPADVHGIVSALLDAVDGYDADRLRAQLATARSGSIGDPQALGFEVAADAPAALLHDFVWPVVATFERAGRSHEVVLEVSEGRLWRLSQFVDDEDLDPETVDWSWPSADQLSVTPGSRTWE